MYAAQPVAYAQSGDCSACGNQELVQTSQVLAQGLEFAQAVARAGSLDDVYLLLTNDVRCILEFDRCFLVSHLGGDSRFVAASGLLAPEKKSRFHKEVIRLGSAVAGLTRPLLFSADSVDRLGEAGMAAETQAALKSFVEFSECAHLFALPLTFNNSSVGHLIFEFMDGSMLDRIGVIVLGRIEPLLAQGLVQRWIMEARPSIAALARPGTQAGSAQSLWKTYKRWIAAPALLLALALVLAVPFGTSVGGEAEVIPGARHLAFCKMDGIIEKVHATEGSEVAAGQVLATLSPRDLDLKISVTHRELEMLSREAAILKDGAGANPIRLAQAQLVGLSRQKKQTELDYLKSQRDYLEIVAPVAGTVTTKNVQTLSGKRLGGGEPFCEIAARSQLCVDVYVPEDRIDQVKPGQEVWVYLNSDPASGYQLQVKEIAPKAEVLPRFGNVFRARADFKDAPASTMVGMKGIGKISTGSASIWSMVSRRLLARWNQLYASFQ